jgi:hypothetical protein
VKVSKCDLHAVESSDLLEAHTVGNMTSRSDGTQAGPSDSSCAVVGVTARGVALKDATKNSREGNDEEEVELHG